MGGQLPGKHFFLGGGGGQLFGGTLIREGSIILEDNFPEGNYPRGQLVVGQLSYSQKYVSVSSANKQN